jgi:hypothetical protein
MSATFTTVAATVTFGANATSWAEPATAEVSTRGFPGGDSVAISLGGQREITRTFGFECDTLAAFKLLRSMRGKLGSLTVGEWDTVGAVGAILRTISPDPPTNNGRVYGTVQFVLVDL